MKHKILIIFILIIASILRLYGLSENPPHLTNDEAALGYNAYSILKTGRDEHGEFLPIIFKSFGDWKPGLYIYLTVPFVALFGLDEFSTRSVGAFSGILAVFLVYLISNKLFPDKKFGVWTTLFLTISPWHIHFSRGGWEAGLSLTLTLAGIYFFLRSIKDNIKYLYFSAIFFSVTLWAYQGAKFSTLIVLLSLLIAFYKDILKFPKKALIISVFLGLIISFPIISSFTQGKTGRLEIYNIFSYSRPVEIIAEILAQENITQSSLQYNLYHSETLNFTRGILSRYLNHFSGRFLFFEGDWQSKRHSAPNSGMMLSIDIILLIFGFIFLIRNLKNRSIIFLLFWLVLSPLSSALSRDDVHAVRSFSMVIPLVFILSLGACFFTSVIKNKIWLVILLSLYLLNFTYYLDLYFIHLPKQFAQDWHYGYKQVVKKVSSLQSNYNEIILKQDYSQPYIFFLFYQKYDPKKYQENYGKNYISSSNRDVGLISKLDNITFRNLNWGQDRGEKGKLFVLDTVKVPIKDSSDPKEFKQIDEIKYPNGKIAFRLIEILDK